MGATCSAKYKKARRLGEIHTQDEPKQLNEIKLYKTKLRQLL